MNDLIYLVTNKQSHGKAKYSFKPRFIYWVNDAEMRNVQAIKLCDYSSVKSKSSYANAPMEKMPYGIESWNVIQKIENIPALVSRLEMTKIL